LQIRVEYLGRSVACQHCQGRFVAIDPAAVRGEYVDRSRALLRRADELLENVSHRDASSRAPFQRHDS
jgi:hypothetical protein